MKLKAFMPSAVLITALALTFSGMSNGWQRDDFKVTLDDKTGLLSGISIKGNIYSSADKLIYSFDAGKCSTAELTKSADIWDARYYGVRGKDGVTDFHIGYELSLPDDAVISDKNVKYDSDGRAVSPDNEHAIVSTDRIGYRLYLTDFMHKNYHALGGVNVLNVGKDGLRVSLIPKKSMVLDVSSAKTTYEFSSDPKDYYFDSISDPDFSELISDEYVYIESLENLSVYFADLAAERILHFSADGTTELCKLPADREVMTLIGEAGAVGIVTADEDNIYLSVNGLSEHIISRRKSPSENIGIRQDASNGAFTFRIQQDGEVWRYVVMDKNGLIAEWDTEPAEFKSESTEQFINRTIYIPTYYNERDFDTYYDGERLYLMENSQYYLYVDLIFYQTMADDLFAKYGGALTGCFVYVTVLDKSGVIAERLTPITIDISKYGSKTVELEIGGRS